MQIVGLLLSLYQEKSVVAEEWKKLKVSSKIIMQTLKISLHRITQTTPPKSWVWLPPELQINTAETSCTYLYLPEFNTTPRYKFWK